MRHCSEGVPVSRVLALTCALLVLSGCAQWQTYKCVRDAVARNEPYHSQADRDDSELLARQVCRERTSASRP